MNNKEKHGQSLESLDDLITAMYRSVSGPKGGLDMEMERRIFTPDARLIRTGLDEDGKPWRKVMSLEDFEEDTRDFLASTDFYEYETARTVIDCRPFAYVLSEYEARTDLDSDELFLSGVNSIQCLFDGTRWWIHTMMWNQRK